MEEVKKQHEERAIDFLVNELEVYETEEEAQARFQILISDWLSAPSNQHYFENVSKFNFTIDVEGVNDNPPEIFGASKL